MNIYTVGIGTGLNFIFLIKLVIPLSLTLLAVGHHCFCVFTLAYATMNILYNYNLLVLFVDNESLIFIQHLPTVYRESIKAKIHYQFKLISLN